MKLLVADHLLCKLRAVNIKLIWVSKGKMITIITTPSWRTI